MIHLVKSIFIIHEKSGRGQKQRNMKVRYVTWITSNKAVRLRLVELLYAGKL